MAHAGDLFRCRIPARAQHATALRLRQCHDLSLCGQQTDRENLHPTDRCAAPGGNRAGKESQRLSLGRGEAHVDAQAPRAACCSAELRPSDVMLCVVGSPHRGTTGGHETADGVQEAWGSVQQRQLAQALQHEVGSPLRRAAPRSSHLLQQLACTLHLHAANATGSADKAVSHRLPITRHDA